MNYRCYFDEVGNDLKVRTTRTIVTSSLTGVIVELGYVKNTLHPQMEASSSSSFTRTQTIRLSSTVRI